MAESYTMRMGEWISREAGHRDPRVRVAGDGGGSLGLRRCRLEAGVETSGCGRGEWMPFVLGREDGLFDACIWALE